MRVGDLVMIATLDHSVRRYYGKAPWQAVKVMGVIKADDGFHDGTGEYLVHTVDGKSIWVHHEHLKPLTD